MIKSSITTHTKSAKHMEYLKKWAEQNKGDEEVKVFLEDYYKDYTDETGAGVPADLKVRRYKIVESFMAAGVQLSVCDALRSTLRGQDLSLTESSHLRMFVPLIERKESCLVIKKIGKNPWSLTLDGTRRNGEALAGVGRWCSQPDFVLHHLLTLFVTTQKNVSGRELAILVTKNEL